VQPAAPTRLRAAGPATERGQTAAVAAAPCEARANRSGALVRSALRATARTVPSDLGDAHERTVAEGIVVHLQERLAKKPSRTPEEEEFIVNILSTWKEARALGRDEGLALGRDEGRAAEAARAVLTALRVRGIVVPDVARERILAEKDLERLERWHERAILAASISEVIDEPT
jgi:hypothetical protein